MDHLRELLWPHEKPLPSEVKDQQTAHEQALDRARHLYPERVNRALAEVRSLEATAKHR